MKRRCPVCKDPLPARPDRSTGTVEHLLSCSEAALALSRNASRLADTVLANLRAAEQQRTPPPNPENETMQQENIPPDASPQTAHTPGPWSMTHTGNDITITGPADDQWVADVVRSIVAEDGEQEANARLIASAPTLKQQRDDLLAAAKAALENSCAVELGDAWDLLKAAIAAAKGASV